MSDLIQIEMTLDEARETDRLIKRHINTTRYLLLDMRDRKGWKALGYESFVEYGEKELGFQKSHIYDLTNAAEIGLQIGFSDKSENQPKERHLHPLKQVPEAERKAIWDEATRKAEAEHAKLTAQRVEDAVKEWKQRSQDWHSQYIGERDKLRQAEMNLTALEKRIDHYTTQPAPEPVIVEKEVIPEDYEDLKQQAATLQSQTATLQKELDKLQKQQAKLVNEQVKTKLQGYQNEVNAMEQKKAAMQEQVDRMKAYMESLDNEAKRIEVHQSIINGTRLELIGLAGFLSDMEPMTDADTVKRWQALAGMLDDASRSIRMVFEPALTELTESR